MLVLRQVYLFSDPFNSLNGSARLKYSLRLRTHSVAFGLLRGHVSNNLDNPQFLLENELSFLHLLKSLNLYEG